MLTPARLVATGLIAVLVSGCALDNLWNDVPVRPVATTPAAQEQTPTEVPAEEPTEEEDAYAGALARGATCLKASKVLLHELEDAAGVGGAITYPQGVVVKSPHGWWTVAVATAVHANTGGYTRKNVESVAYFAASADDPADGADVTQEAQADTPAANKALGCLLKLPAVKPDPKPSSPADTYNGRPAAGAKCRAVSAKLLARLQEVGQVGGAITYPRGQMVRANRKWWTVAVATQVHPNSQGYTTDNVPAFAWFVTNAPSVGLSGSSAYTFPIKGKDKASARAVDCLR